MSQKHYTVTFTANQLTVIEKACDLYLRLHLGQLKEVADLFIGRIPAASRDDAIKKHRELKDALVQLAPIVTGMSNPHASFGIDNPEVHPDHAIAYEIARSIEHYLRPSFRSEPLKISPEPLPIIEKSDRS